MASVLMPKYTALDFDDFEKTKLSITEWHVCEYLYLIRDRDQYSSHKISVFDEIALKMKLTRRTIERCVSVLVDEGYVIKTGPKKIRTTKKWYELRNAEHSEEEIAEYASVDEFFSQVEALYPRKDFTDFDKKMIVSKGIMQLKEQFLTAIRNYKLTKNAHDGHTLALSSFINRWKSYADGVPAGVLLADGTVSSGQKISNGAAAEITDSEGFSEMVLACAGFVESLSGMAFAQKQAVLDAANFSEWFDDGVQSDTVMYFGGLRRLAAEFSNSSFKEELRKAWHVANGGAA